jgi:hypothetical protein
MVAPLLAGARPILDLHHNVLHVVGEIVRDRIERLGDQVLEIHERQVDGHGDQGRYRPAMTLG